MAVAEARSVQGAGEAVTGDLDVAAVLGRRDRFTRGWNDEGQVRWLDTHGIDLVRGNGRLAGERRGVVGRAPGRAGEAPRPPPPGPAPPPAAPVAPPPPPPAGKTPSSPAA